MSTERIIYTGPEGNLCVVIPSGALPLAEVIAKDIPEGAGGISVVDASEIPADRTFRNAWKSGEQGKKVGVEMLKAKEIAHDKRRAKRAAEFAPLDVDATIPAKATEAEAKRQQIRDKNAVIQTSIDAATTPEQLKAIIDTEGL